MQKKIMITAGCFLLAIACCTITIRNKPTFTEQQTIALTPSVKTISRQFAKSEKEYKQQINVLEQTEKKTARELAATKLKLNTTRNNNKRLLKQLEDAYRVTIADRDSSKPLPQAIKQLAANDYHKDSLCDEALSKQEQLLMNKDSVIAITVRQHHNTVKALEQSLQLQQYTQYQLKKEKRRKTIWKIATVVIGALIVAHQ